MVTARLLSIVLLLYTFTAARQATPEQLAVEYSLTTSTTLPFPTATQSSSNAQSLITSTWGLNKGRIQDGADDLAFVTDPFPNKPAPGSSGNVSTKAPVLEVTYPARSFSHDTGGAQLYNLWNASEGSQFQSMMVSYELAFDDGFDWVKGGKLPGIKGGLNSTGCTGGNEPNGRDCFSVRLMWRQGGLGEVYAYILRPNNLCDQRSISCNDDFGISLSRGSFTLSSGQWHRIALLVQLNNPMDVANGNIILYYDDVQVISQQGLQIRSASSLSAGGFFLSTFFGGNDDSWATPDTTHSYFRDIRLWGGSQPSNLTGAKVNSSKWAAQPDVALVMSCLLSFFVLLVPL